MSAQGKERGETHMCPPEGSGVMPCCGLSPFEVPRTDRMTLDPALVTCDRKPNNWQGTRRMTEGSGETGLSDRWEAP